MKGTSCGNRAFRLVALAALALAAAPAAASAAGGDSLAGATPAVPVPAAPAGRAVPSAPVPSAPAAAAVPAATATAPKPAIAPVVATAKPTAKRVGKTAPVSAHARARAKRGTITTSSSVTVDLRGLANTSTNPLMGCYGSYQLCQTFPDFPYAANNDCNNEQIPFVGTFTLWTSTTTNLLTGTMVVHQRSYFVGFHGQGDQGNVYTGQDTQNDFQRTFGLTGGVSVDHRDYEVLIVTKKNPADPAPNEYMYFHTVTNVDPLDPMHPQIAIQGPFVVCTCGAKHSKDTNYGGKYNDDDSGDKHHHQESYKGYNDDANTWDD